MKTFTLAALVAASLTAAPAFAQTGGETRIVVSHADLDLATARGRATLDLRLLHAARAACGTPSPADARGPAKVADCVAQARIGVAAQREAIIASAERRARPTLASR